MSKAKPYRTWSDIVTDESNAPTEKRGQSGCSRTGAGVGRGMSLFHRDMKIDDELVSSIVESFSVCSGDGPFNPIIVRRVREQEDGEEVIKIVLVAGAQRLQAARVSMTKYINCVLYRRRRNRQLGSYKLGRPFRKHLTVLKRSELLTEDKLSRALANLSEPSCQEERRTVTCSSARLHVPCLYLAGLLKLVARSSSGRFR